MNRNDACVSSWPIESVGVSGTHRLPYRKVIILLLLEERLQIADYRRVPPDGVLRYSHLLTSLLSDGELHKMGVPVFVLRGLANFYVHVDVTALFLRPYEYGRILRYGDDQIPPPVHSGLKMRPIERGKVDVADQ